MLLTLLGILCGSMISVIVSLDDWHRENALVGRCLAAQNARGARGRPERSRTSKEIRDLVREFSSAAPSRIHGERPIDQIHSGSSRSTRSKFLNQAQ